MSEELQTSVDQQQAAEGQQGEVQLPNTRVSIVAGILPDGEMFFQTYGTNAGFVELWGLKKYIEKKLDAEADKLTFTGDRVTHEVGKAVGVVNERVNQLEIKVDAVLARLPTVATPAVEGE